MAQSHATSPAQTNINTAVRKAEVLATTRVRGCSATLLSKSENSKPFAVVGYSYRRNGRSAWQNESFAVPMDALPTLSFVCAETYRKMNEGK